MQYNIISSDHGSWKITGPKEGEPEGIEVEYSQDYFRWEFDAPPTNRKAIESFRAFLRGSNTRWVEPSANEWILDLDELRKTFPQLSSLNWVRGKIPVELRVETEETSGSRSLRETLELSGAPKDPFARPTQYTYESKVFFSVSREAAENFGVFMEVPTEVRESIRRFRLDFPDPDKTCFLIMSFRETPANKQIGEAVKKTLGPYEISAIRADERHYHSNLLQNIVTLMYGCNFGIAVFESIEQETFNPNVSFEVGYMMGLGKHVCLLKDKNLNVLHADLIGEVFYSFDLSDPVASISSKLGEWLRDNKLISTVSPR